MVDRFNDYQPGMEDSLADNYLGNPEVVSKLAAEFCSGAMSLMDAGKGSFKDGIQVLIERYADIFSGRSADYRSQVGFNETTLPIRCMVDLGDFWKEQRGAWGDDPVRVFLWWLVCHLVESRSRADGDEMLLGVMFKPNLQAFIQKVLGIEERAHA